MIELNTLYNEDCLIGMKRIKDNSIDMILCDLPYGTTANNWDKNIPSELLWEQYERIIRDNGVIALFGSEPFSTKLKMSNFNLYRYDWYWKKTKPSLYQHAKNRPMKVIETISIFSKAKWGHASQIKPENRMQYNPQGIKSARMKTVTKNYNAGRNVGERPNQIGRVYEAFTGFPHDVLEYPNIIGKQAIHPTQKPVELCEFLIKSYTKKGETVLDNCMGSGTTAIAAHKTKRNWIGFELDKKYYELAKKRIEVETRQKRLF